MPFNEFMLFLLGLVLVSMMGGAFVLARSETPEKLFPVLLFISAVIVIITVAVGLSYYAIAWLWRNPTIALLLFIVGFLFLRSMAKQERLKW